MHLGRNGAGGKQEGPLLTLNQCRENLQQYVSSVLGRLALLRPILAKLGIDMDSAYHAPLEFITKLHGVLIVELPSLYRRELFINNNYELSDRAGADIGLSFMSDLAMLEADVLTKAKRGCFIGMNIDNKDRTMAMYRRPCLLGLTDRLFPDSPPDIFHLEAEWFGYFANMDHPDRLAHPDAINPPNYMDVIGGTLLFRLDRYVVAPELEELLQTTWLGQASAQTG
jgi:hypothetical protein